MDIFGREHDTAVKDITKYLSNPINEYTLIKRLTVDTQYIKLHIRDGSGKAYLSFEQLNFFLNIFHILYCILLLTTRIGFARTRNIAYVDLRRYAS